MQFSLLAISFEFRLDIIKWKCLPHISRVFLQRLPLFVHWQSSGPMISGIQIHSIYVLVYVTVALYDVWQQHCWMASDDIFVKGIMIMCFGPAKQSRHTDMYVFIFNCILCSSTHKTSKIREFVFAEHYTSLKRLTSFISSCMPRKKALKLMSERGHQTI